MNTFFRYLLIGMVLSSATAMGQGLSRSESEQAAQVLAAWLESEHREAALLEPVVRYGQAVVPSLTSALNNGPSAARRERLRRLLDEGYDADAKRAKAKLALSKADYRQHYMSNFDALYRVRAAQALAAIGGDDAIKALKEARIERADTRDAVQQALRDIK
jgi:hypothetical protein